MKGTIVSGYLLPHQRVIRHAPFVTRASYQDPIDKVSKSVYTYHDRPRCEAWEVDAMCKQLESELGWPIEWEDARREDWPLEWEEK